MTGTIDRCRPRILEILHKITNFISSWQFHEISGLITAYVKTTDWE